MAQRVNIELIDDLDGSSVADSTVTFALDGVSYEIDLSDKNAAKLRDALGKYIAKARRTGKAPSGSKASKNGKGTGPAPRDVREWARGNGFEVPDRGRIPAEVQDAYAAAH